MSINLTKGTRVDLSKEAPGLRLVDVGLGWDPEGSNGQGLKGLRSLLGGGSRPNIDVDASCFLLDANNKVISFVYFGNKNDSANGIRLSGDDLTGGSSKGGDDEIIYIDLDKVGPVVAKLDVWANIYDCVNRGQTFGHIQNAFIRLVNKSTGAEICKFNLSGKEYAADTAVKLGSIYRHNGAWKFNATGEGTKYTGLRQIQASY